VSVVQEVTCLIPYKGRQILAIEAGSELSRKHRDSMVDEGFAVRTAVSQSLRSELTDSDRPDLIIVNMDSSDQVDLDICRDIRSRFNGPILVIVGPYTKFDGVAALEAGADQYLRKPVHSVLLLAHIKTLLRWFPNGHSSENGSNGTIVPPFEETTIEIGNMVVDPSKRMVVLDGTEITLTTGEFDLLWLLACHAGEVVTRETICLLLRGIEYDGLDRSIDLRVARLRKKLGDSGRRPRKIKSVRSEGYILVPD